MKLHYLTSGHGPAVILLHGYAETSRMWKPLIPRLAGKFTVIAPDLPFPKAAKDFEELSRTRLTMSCERTVEALAVSGVAHVTECRFPRACRGARLDFRIR